MTIVRASDLKALKALSEDWIDFVPTAAQGAALTVTVTYARYKRIGKTLLVQLRLAFGSAGTAGSALGVTGMPATVAPARSGDLRICGTAVFHDNGTAYYVLGVEWNSPTVLNFYGYNATGYFGADPAVTVASGDALALELAYEAL